MPPDKFKIYGAKNTGEAPVLDKKRTVQLRGVGYIKQEEPESFWPVDYDDYIGWRKLRVKEYFDSFPCWKPFIEQWKDMDDDEKLAHPGLPDAWGNAEDKIEPVGGGNIEGVLNKLRNPIPNPEVARVLTSSGYRNDVRAMTSADAGKTCFESFNDAYGCHLNGRPSSQCMNLLGQTASFCPKQWMDKWLGDIAADKYSGTRRTRNLQAAARGDHGHGHH